MREFFRQYKYYIMIPFILSLIGIVALILLSGGSKGVGPFVYFF